MHVEGTVDKWPVVALAHAVLGCAFDFVGLSFIELSEKS